MSEKDKIVIKKIKGQQRYAALRVRPDGTANAIILVNNSPEEIITYLTRGADPRVRGVPIDYANSDTEQPEGTKCCNTIDQ